MQGMKQGMNFVIEFFFFFCLFVYGLDNETQQLPIVEFSFLVCVGHGIRVRSYKKNQS